MKGIFFAFFLIALLSNMNTIQAASYDIDINQDLFSKKIDIEVIIMNFDTTKDYVLKISSHTIEVPKGYVSVFPMMAAQDVVFEGTVGETSVFGGNSFNLSEVRYEILSNETNESYVKWIDIIIPYPDELKKYKQKNFKLRISGIDLPGLITYRTEKFPNDYGNIDFTLMFPDNSSVAQTFTVPKYLSIDSIMSSQKNEYRKTESIINCSSGFTQTTFEQNKVTLYSLDYQKVVRCDVEADKYINTKVLFSRPNIYYSSLQTAILIAIVLIASGMLFRRFEIFLSLFMFLAAIFSLFNSFRPEQIPTLLDTQILDLIPYILAALLITIGIKIIEYSNKIGWFNIKNVECQNKYMHKEKDEKIKKDIWHRLSNKISILMEKRLYNYVEIIFGFMMLPIALIWVGGMMIEMIKNVTSEPSALNYLIKYGEICLTLFGFTMLGAVFEKKRLEKEDKATLHKLFHLSIVFLASAISFFVLYSITFYNTNSDTAPSYLVILGGGILNIFTIIFILISHLGLIYGSLLLLGILIKYSRKLRKENLYTR